VRAGELAAVAHELRAHAARQQPYLEDLLKALVETESHASQPQGVDAVARMVLEPLERMGFRSTPTARPDLSRRPPWLRELMLPGFDYDRIADVRRLTLPGIGEPVLVLADLDTAFLPGITREFSFSTNHDLAFGPGIADMKGGLVVLVGACSMLHALGYPHPPLTVILAPDEQAGSLASGPLIAEEASRSAACICLECAREGGNLMGSRASCGVGRIKVVGQEAHAGTDHAAGRSAVRGFADAVAGIEGLTDPAKRRFVTITQVRAGWRRSVIPGECDVTLDIRAADSAAWNQLEGRIRAVLRERIEAQGFQVEADMAQHRPGVTRSARSEPLIETVMAAGHALDLDFGVIGSNAAGSSAFANSIPVIDGLGPPGSQLMTEGENISRAGLLDRSCLLALTLASLAT
jgi:glutamate carboxypeptidase